jgi:hypothetical protein
LSSYYNLRETHNVCLSYAIFILATYFAPGHNYCVQFTIENFGDTIFVKQCMYFSKQTWTNGKVNCLSDILCQTTIESSTKWWRQMFYANHYLFPNCLFCWGLTEILSLYDSTVCSSPLRFYTICHLSVSEYFMN